MEKVFNLLSKKGFRVVGVERSGSTINIKFVDEANDGVSLRDVKYSFICDRGIILGFSYTGISGVAGSEYVINFAG